MLWECFASEETVVLHMRKKCSENIKATTQDIHQEDKIWTSYAISLVEFQPANR